MIGKVNIKKEETEKNKINLQNMEIIQLCIESINYKMAAQNRIF